jgi:glucose-1-phosphate adenylyltransferase
MHDVVALILGGGRGTRLFPLTKTRSKPAVPLAGNYRLIDVTVSNCINSKIDQIYVLTQFNSASLHRHISRTYRFDTFSKGFVEILAAEQTPQSMDWYQGTADAVRKNSFHFEDHAPDHYLILSGDQLYRMDFGDMFRAHLASKADVTIAATPVPRHRVAGLGILQVDASQRITQFVEKPAPDTDISSLAIPREVAQAARLAAEGEAYLASMGIYIFTAEGMRKALDNTLTDFGSEIIPASIEHLRVSAYLFDGYWEDIGTIGSFYDANINLASINPDFNLYLETIPIYTNRRDLPPSKINYSTISQSLAAEGSIITNANISNSIVGIRTIIETGANLDGVICMGADFYETAAQKAGNREAGVPNVGIGRCCIVKRAIIDKDARIGDNCRIGIDPLPRPDLDTESYSIRDGIVVIPKGTVLQPGTVI